jgi:hypothetical protein
MPRAVRDAPIGPNDRRPFRLMGPVTRWSPGTSEVSILDHALELAPRVSTREIALGVPVAVAGYHDPATDRWVVTRLVRA